MAKYINQDDLLYYLHKIIHDHINNNDNEDIAIKAIIEQMIKLIENFPTTDIQFKNGKICVNARSIIKEGAENAQVNRG